MRNHQFMEGLDSDGLEQTLLSFSSWRVVAAGHNEDGYWIIFSQVI